MNNGYTFEQFVSAALGANNFQPSHSSAPLFSASVPQHIAPLSQFQPSLSNFGNFARNHDFQARANSNIIQFAPNALQVPTHIHSHPRIQSNYGHPSFATCSTVPRHSGWNNNYQSAVGQFRAVSCVRPRQHNPRFVYSQRFTQNHPTVSNQALNTQHLDKHHPRHGFVKSFNFPGVSMHSGNHAVLSEVERVATKQKAGGVAMTPNIKFADMTKESVIKDSASNSRHSCHDEPMSRITQSGNFGLGFHAANAVGSIKLDNGGGVSEENRQCKFNYVL